VDVAIRVRDKLDTDGELQMKVIGRSVSILVATPAFLDAHGRPERPADVPAYATISHTDRPGLDRWTIVNREGEEQVVLHEPRLSASTFPILREAALDGLGIAFLPEYICREALEDGGLERVLPEWVAPDGILHLVFTSRRGLLPGVRAMIDFIAETVSPRSATWEIGI
jgi:DNA-binding transcriptional LysR family regulator